MSSNNRGFTLLEVLIAGVILFSVISGASLVYTSAIKSKINATNNIKVHGVLPLISENVQNQVKKGATKGSASLWGVNYQWQVIAKQAGAVRQDANSESSRRVFLNTVRVDLQNQRALPSLDLKVLTWE